MNARGIHRRLMRNRTRTMWGRRSIMTVRIPLTVTGKPPEHISFPGLEEQFGGYWTSPDENEVVRIEHSVMGADPRLNTTETCYFVQEIYGGDFSFWTAFRMRRTADGTQTFEALPEALVAQYRDRELWFARLEHHEHPILRALHATKEHASSLNWYVDDDHLYAQYAIKWYYRTDRRRFCTTLSRAVKLARRSGVEARVR